MGSHRFPRLPGVPDPPRRQHHPSLLQSESFPRLIRKDDQLSLRDIRSGATFTSPKRGRGQTGRPACTEAGSFLPGHVHKLHRSLASLAPSLRCRPNEEGARLDAQRVRSRPFLLDRAQLASLAPSLRSLPRFARSTKTRKGPPQQPAPRRWPRYSRSPISCRCGRRSFPPVRGRGGRRSGSDELGSECADSGSSWRCPLRRRSAFEQLLPPFSPSADSLVFAMVELLTTLLTDHMEQEGETDIQKHGIAMGTRQTGTIGISRTRQHERHQVKDLVPKRGWGFKSPLRPRASVRCRFWSQRQGAFVVVRPDPCFPALPSRQQQL